MTGCIVIFDGACGFCRRQAKRIERLDRRRQFDLLPRRTEGLLERYPALRDDWEAEGMRLLDERGVVHIGADAVYEIHRRLPRYRWLAWLYRVPGLRQLFRAMYGWVSRNRYRFGRAVCEDGSCGASKPRV